MEYRQLGKDGPQVSVIGLGAWPLAGGMGPVDEQNAIATIHAAIDHDITLIDTAQGYRGSEAIIGKALTPSLREKCFIASKVTGHYKPVDIRAAIENSLSAMKIEQVDLYQIHGLNPDDPIEDSMAEMEKLQQEGKVRYIGVSNYGVEHMRQALSVTYFSSNQPRYNMLNRQIEADVVPFCEREGIAILAHSALAKGLLGGHYTPETTCPPSDERSDKPEFQGERFQRALAGVEKLKVFAADKGITLVHLAIAWQLRLPAITSVLVGPKSPQQVADYVGAVGVTFNQDELAEIDAIVGDIPGMASR